MYRDGQTRGSWNRRAFLTSAAGVACGPALLKAGAAVVSAGRFRRMNLAKPTAAQNLLSYERAITEMLSLPPTDPRNWYRNAFVHLFDCPHGNWWFLPWHRGYLGYFELICRDLSKDPDFALPYWDWTADPRLPAKFLEGNLNPANHPIKSLAEFKSEFTAPMNDFWNSLNADQLNQLKLRGFNSIDDVWTVIEGKADPSDTATLFPSPPDARNLNPPHTQEFDDRTRRAVDISTILDALAPREFLPFGSGKTDNHHGPTSGSPQFGVLEGQPHNLVHNLVGGYIQGNPSRQGFMSAFLSPIDPIFFMHHSNIDRVWNVWTRKQRAHPSATYPTTPVGADLTAWNSEPFLFFVGTDGKPAPKMQSGDFVDSDAFNYDYEPGSGEVVVPGAARAVASPLANRSFTGQLIGLKAAVAVPNTVPAAAATATEAGLRLVATITVQLPRETRNLRVNVILNPPPGSTRVGITDPGYVGTFELFGGRHGHGRMNMNAAHGQDGAVTFTMGLTDAMNRLQGTPRLNPNEPLHLQVVADTPDIQLAVPEVKLLDVTVKTL